MPKVYLASDHAGYELKSLLVSYIGTLGHEAEDLGPHTLDPEDDYPDFINPLAERVSDEPGSFGIVLGASGQGEAMAANRVQGIRAAVYYGAPLELVQATRAHNNANILSLGARFLTTEEAKIAVQTFLSTAFSGEERHVRRLGKF